MHRLKINQKRLPYGGHHFPEKGALIKGDSFEDVVDLLHNFRLINARPLGNARQEIIDYYSVKFPWMVELETKPIKQIPVDPDYKQWRDWIASVWGKPMGNAVSKKESSMRLEVCRTCPHNIPKNWNETEESIEFNRKALMLSRGNFVDEKYGFCSLHKADLGVLSFLESPLQVSGKDKDKQDYPACWLTNLGS